MSAVRSMTGFARVRRSSPEAELVISIKSLNHRGLDIHVHAPPELDQFEATLRAAVKRKVARGHLEVRIVFERVAGAQSLAVNRPMLAAYVSAFRQAAAEHALSAEPDLNVAFRVPGMLGEPLDAELKPELQQMLVAALEEALDCLNQFREREGAELAAVVRQLGRRITESAAEIEQIRSRAMPAFQARLSERLSELLKTAALDPQRLAQEAALIADRSDIGEEVARLKIHAGQLDDLLDSGGEAGKKLDFLVQEMNRETNTILSKTTGIGELGLRITELALAAKSEIEKIREQALNLE